MSDQFYGIIWAGVIIASAILSLRVGWRGCE